jgi:hypothetical protein
MILKGVESQKMVGIVEGVHMAFYMRHKQKRWTVYLLASWRYAMVEEDTQHRHTSLDLPKAKAIAGSFGTPNYYELPLSISSVHSFIYNKKIRRH